MPSAGTSSVRRPPRTSEGDQVMALAAVQQMYPAWHIWASDKGRLWATRWKPRAIPLHMPRGFAVTIDADDAAGMARAIQTQEDLDGG